MSDSSSNSVRVVKRAFDILEAFDDREPVLSLQKISERINLPKTTTFRLLATMMESGYILQRGNQEYCLSHKFMSIASVDKSTFEIRDTARARKSVVSGKSVSVRVDPGGRRHLKKKKKRQLIL